MGELAYLKDVVSLEFHPQKCNGCGRCLLVCPHAVIRLDNGRAEIDRRDDCMECGACATNCPSEAIAVQAGVGCAAAVIASYLPKFIMKRVGDCCG